MNSSNKIVAQVNGDPMSNRKAKTWLGICKNLDEQQKYCFKNWADFWERSEKIRKK